MRFARILVAVDASRESLAALQAAADMASRLDADLHALFVEDIDLLRLSGYSFARELGNHSGASRPLDAPTVEKTLKRMADEARSAIELAAARLGIRWSFAVARGAVVAEVLAAAGGADLVALGMSSHRPGPRRRLGSTARRVLEGAHRSVLLFHGNEPVKGPVLLVADESALPEEALERAVRLAEGCGEEVVPLVAARDPAAVRRLDDAVRAALGRTTLRWRAPRAVEPRAGRLMRALRELRPGAVILAGAGFLASDELLREMIERVESPLLIVR